MNKKDTLSNIRKIETVNDALKSLSSVGAVGGDYVTYEFDGGSFFCGMMQIDGNEDILTNDLDAKVPNGTITRREQIGGIIGKAMELAMVDESYMPEIVPDIANLYAMENGADHDVWTVSARQINAIGMSMYIEELYVTFNRSAKTVEVDLALVESDAVRYSFTAEANLETNAVNVTQPFEVVSVLTLHTWNNYTYEPESDYNPATKKYVDDKVAPIVRGALIHTEEGDNTTITIENLGNLSRKVDLGTANKPNIILNFRYKKPAPMPTINSDDLVEVNVEAFLDVDASLTNVTTQYNFYDDGILQDGSKYLFQNGEQPTLEAGHKYQIFISYYVNYSKQVLFATVGVVDFGAVNGSAEPTGN